MADSGFLKYAAFAAAAWVGYEYFLKPKLATAAPSPTPAPPTPAPAPDPNKIVGANTLDGVYARMIAAAPSGSHGVDDWNVYLMSSVGGGFVAPDPMPIFSAAVSGFDRSQKLTAGQYWAVMAPWLKTNAGLSGLGARGLGCMYEVMR